MNASDEWAIWTFYNVLLPAVLPIALVWAGLRLVRKPKALMEIIGDGQLCFFDRSRCCNAQRYFPHDCSEAAG